MDFAKAAHSTEAELVTMGLPFFVHLSHRGFLTITGEFKGTPVSIVAIGMGLPMMDFFVRECRAVIKGPMVVIRYILVSYIDSAFQHRQP